jgi:hypothetical protein
LESNISKGAGLPGKNMSRSRNVERNRVCKGKCEPLIWAIIGLLRRRQASDI